MITVITSLLHLLLIPLSIYLARTARSLITWVIPIAISSWVGYRFVYIYRTLTDPSLPGFSQGREILLLFLLILTAISLFWFIHFIKEEKTARQSGQDQIQRLLNQQLAINHLVLELGQYSQLDKILEIIYSFVSRFMEADAFILSRVEPQAKKIFAEYVVIDGVQQDVREYPPLPLAEEGEGAQSQVIHSGEPLYLPDWVGFMKMISPLIKKYEQPDEKGQTGLYHIDSNGGVNQELPAEGDTQSALLVPMRIGGQVIGVLQVQSYRFDAYEQADIDLLAGLGNVAAIAIQNARLLSQTTAQTKNLQHILDTVPVGVLLIDENNRPVMLNQPAKNFLPFLADPPAGGRLNALFGRPLDELLKPPPSGLWYELAEGDRQYTLVSQPITLKNGRQGWVIVLQDVTDIKEIQMRVQGQERLAAVGQLAAGIAHDFNNIMAVVTLYAQLMMNDPTLASSHQDHLQTINLQAERASQLIQQILDFSRRAVLERQALELKPFLKEVTRFLQRTMPANIHIEFSADGQAYTVNADPTRMQQLIMNLSLNARDAMPEGGVLSLNLGMLTLNAGDKRPFPRMADVDWVHLAVTDSGTGIPPEVEPHIFEPFYTTKAPGKGSGLGLAQVYGIVKQHDGYIFAHTAIGQGTRFDIYFPSYQSGKNLIAPPHPMLKTPKGSGEKILVVEDNDLMREALVTSLNSLNYQPAAVANGREALEILSQNEADYSVILSDIIMPEMGGFALLNAIRSLGSDIPVVYLTGYALDTVVDDLGTRGAAGILTKPLDLIHLAELLKSICSPVNHPPLN